MSFLSRIIVPLVAISAISGCNSTSSVRSCAEARQQVQVGTNIGDITLPSGIPTRVMSPGMAMTEDYSPNRLNVFVDDKGWIARVTCG